MKLSESSRKQLQLFDDKEHKRIEKCIKKLPVARVEVKGYVMKADNVKDPKVLAGDLLTIEITANLPNQSNRESRGFIHTTQFPFMKKDHFVVLITNADGSRILNFERVYEKSNKLTWKMQFRTGEPMKMSLIAHLRNDSYVGLDFSQNLIIDVHPQPEDAKPIDFNYSKHDLKEIAKKTILGQEVLINPEDQDSDEDLEEEYKHEQKEESEEED